VADEKHIGLVLQPGPYDRVAAQLLQELRADGVVLVVFGGRVGTSGSVATTDRQRFIELRTLVEKLLNPEPPPPSTIEVA
jgi:hypothetical protein